MKVDANKNKFEHRLPIAVLVLIISFLLVAHFHGRKKYRILLAARDLFNRKVNCKTFNRLQIKNVFVENLIEQLNRSIKCAGNGFRRNLYHTDGSYLIKGQIGCISV